jgi:hypothetical protein
MCFLQVKFGGVFRGSFGGARETGFFLVGTYFRGGFSFGESFGVVFLGFGGGGERGGEDLGTWKGEDYLCDLT